MNSRKLDCALIIVGLVGGLSVRAADYAINITGSGSDAHGTIKVEGGFAVNGSLQVTAGPDIGTYALALGNGERSVRLADGTDLIYDNVVNLGSNPFLTGDGLAFVSAALDKNGHPLVGLNLWGNGSPDSFTLFLDPPYSAVPVSANITAVPEPYQFGLASMVGLFGLVFVDRLRQRKLNR